MENPIRIGMNGANSSQFMASMGDVRLVAATDYYRLSPMIVVAPLETDLGVVDEGRQFAAAMRTRIQRAIELSEQGEIR